MGKDTFLMFSMENEKYAFDIFSVLEVINFQPLTKVPLSPDFLEGILNLRGKPLPVVDLRKKLGFYPKETTLDTSIIVVELEINKERSEIGIIVDEVNEVIEINREDISPPPTVGMKLNSKYITGIAKFKEQFVILIDIKQIFSEEELDEITPNMES
jgi:purine-binding chemotaxis protein CheW